MAHEDLQDRFLEVLAEAGFPSDEDAKECAFNMACLWCGYTLIYMSSGYNPESFPEVAQVMAHEKFDPFLEQWLQDICLRIRQEADVEKEKATINDLSAPSNEQSQSEGT